ncbi:MAG TPA: hypothetical protein VJH70_02935 [Candidatus Paceibacterota bacterium]
MKTFFSIIIFIIIGISGFLFFYHTPITPQIPVSQITSLPKESSAQKITPLPTTAPKTTDTFSITNVNGNLKRGEIVTISGNYFGKHPDYSPTLPDTLGSALLNFENNQLTGNGWVIDQAPENWRLSNNGERSNSAYHAEKFYNPIIKNRLGSIEITQTGTPHEWYSVFWFKLLPNTQAGKFFRIYGARGSSENIYLSTGGENTMIRGFSECVTCGEIKTVWNSPNSFGYDQWHLVEINMKETSHTFRVFMDGQLQWERNNWVNDPFNGTGHTWEIGQMIDAPANGTIGGAYAFDDVYFDYTQARVMIGNDPIFEQSTIREIQVPTEWSDTTITIHFNPGSFSSGQKVYLFVINSDGTATAGFPITIQ